MRGLPISETSSFNIAPGIIEGALGLSQDNCAAPFDHRKVPVRFSVDNGFKIVWKRATGMLALTVPVDYPGAPCDLGIKISQT